MTALPSARLETEHASDFQGWSPGSGLSPQAGPAYDFSCSRPILRVREAVASFYVFLVTFGGITWSVVGLSFPLAKLTLTASHSGRSQTGSRADALPANPPAVVSGAPPGTLATSSQAESLGWQHQFSQVWTESCSRTPWHPRNNLLPRMKLGNYSNGTGYGIAATAFFYYCRTGTC